ncbi:MAG TPA: DUF4270 family protein, partial [Salinivirgaceae bacterium]|nr:DUF4270 family protein [Salinivirgaceae bacterium]
MIKKISCIFLTLSIIFGCKKEDSIIGIDLQENKFEIRFDTLTHIRLATKLADSLTFNGAGLGLLGDYQDSLFGRTRSALAFEILPKSKVVNLGDNPIADSVVLRLSERSGYYGLDSAARQIVRVYRVQTGKSLKDFDSTVVGFNRLAEYKGELLAEREMVFNTKDSLPFEIKLSPAFAAALLQDTAYIKSDSLFKIYLPGLIVEAERISANGNIITIDFNQLTTRMRLHFKNSVDTLYFDYYVKTTAYRFSIFDHQYQGTSVGVSLQDSTYGQLAFLQAMNGVATRVKISNLDTLFSDQPWALNSALLNLNLAPESDTARFIPPSQIMVKMKKDGKEVFIPD